MGHTSKNGTHLEKWITLGKRITLRTVSHTWKNGSHLGKWLTLEKMGHAWKRGDTLGKIGEIWKNESNLEK